MILYAKYIISNINIYGTFIYIRLFICYTNVNDKSSVFGVDSFVLVRLHNHFLLLNVYYRVPNINVNTRFRYLLVILF